MKLNTLNGVHPSDIDITENISDRLSYALYIYIYIYIIQNINLQYNKWGLFIEGYMLKVLIITTSFFIMTDTFNQM